MEDDAETNPSDSPEGSTHIARANPFLRFAFTPADISTPNSPLGKRKQRDNLLANATADKRAKKGLSVSGSKRVKVYDHLQEVGDHLAHGLDVIFCGINPGQQSAEIGHHYGNPTNHFWSCLHESGFTPRKLDPREDFKLPREFCIGLTNLTSRPTIEQSELSKVEQAAGVSTLLEKITKFAPRIVCFVGLGIADIVKAEVALPKRVGNRAKYKAEVGLQPYKVVHSQTIGSVAGVSETLFFAVSSTSGRVVRYQKGDKIQQFKDLRHVLLQVKDKTFDSSQITSILPHREAVRSGSKSQ